MRAAPGAEIVTYLDGDLWFLADPEPVYREMGLSSVLIIPHGFAPVMKHRERYGVYNVGWVSFRADARGKPVCNGGGSAQSNGVLTGWKTAASRIKAI